MSAPYYLLIPNGPKRGAPVKPHTTIEAAQIEARRLHALFGGTLYIRVLETLQDVEATHFRAAEGSKPIPRIIVKRKRQIEMAAA